MWTVFITEPFHASEWEVNASWERDRDHGAKYRESKRRWLESVHSVSLIVLPDENQKKAVGIKLNQPK